MIAISFNGIFDFSSYESRNTVILTCTKDSDLLAKNCICILNGYM